MRASGSVRNGSNHAHTTLKKVVGSVPMKEHLWSFPMKVICRKCFSESSRKSSVQFQFCNWFVFVVLYGTVSAIVVVQLYFCNCLVFVFVFVFLFSNCDCSIANLQLPCICVCICSIIQNCVSNCDLSICISAIGMYLCLYLYFYSELC